jgi:hypothetical protein
MGFLRRLTSGGDKAQPEWIVPEGDDMSLGSTFHHRDAIGKLYGRVEEQVKIELTTTLVREPQNEHDPNAVAVLVQGVLAAHLPRNVAAAWSARLAEAEARGIAVRAHGRLDYYWPHDERKPDAWLHLWIDETPPPLPPSA